MPKTKMGMLLDNQDVKRIYELTLWGMGENGRFVTTDELKDRLTEIRHLVEPEIERGS